MMTAATKILIDLQIMWNRLIAVVEEQAQALIHRVLADRARMRRSLGRRVRPPGPHAGAGGYRHAGHVNSMAELVEHFIRHFPLDTMKPGDAYITNDPWTGTGAPQRFRDHDAGVQQRAAGRPVLLH